MLSFNANWKTGPLPWTKKNKNSPHRRVYKFAYTLYHHQPLFYLSHRLKKKEIDAGRCCMHLIHQHQVISLCWCWQERVGWQRTLAAPFFQGWRIHSDILHIPDICWVTHVADAFSNQESHNTDYIEKYNSVYNLCQLWGCSTKFDSRSSGRFFLRERFCNRPFPC